MRKALLSLFLILVVCGAGSLGFLVAWQTRAPLIKELSEHQASISIVEEKFSAMQAEASKATQQLARNKQVFEAEVKALTSANAQEIGALADGHKQEMNAAGKQFALQIAKLKQENLGLNKTMATLTSDAKQHAKEMLKLKSALDERVAKTDSAATAQNAALAEKNAQLVLQTKEQGALNTQLTAQNTELKGKLVELTAQNVNVANRDTKLAELSAELEGKKIELEALQKSQATTAAAIAQQIEEAKEQVKAQFSTTQQENTYLYGELDRYAQTANEMLNQLGEDVGGLDILLSPKFKADYAEFLDEINLKSD